MFVQVRTSAQQWLHSNREVVLCAIIVAVILYAIGASIESRLARRTLIEKIEVLERKCK